VNIPRFWAPARGEARRGRTTLALLCWGWSNESRAEAEARARETLGRLVERVLRGEDPPRGYGYGTRPLREEIAQELRGDDGELAGVVTRNAYGALVLNAARALFIDVDLPPVRRAGLFRRWFGPSEPDPAEGVLARLRDTLRAQPGVSFRVYRTAAGFRVLATDPPFEPGDAASRALLEKAGADPAFVRLCGLQQSFRARLTPKPWRCGRPLPPNRYPREDADAAARFARWLADYEAASASYATCRFLECVGRERVDPALAPLLRLHDERSGASSGRPLA
jgi:hypothetical protein